MGHFVIFGVFAGKKVQPNNLRLLRKRNQMQEENIFYRKSFFSGVREFLLIRVLQLSVELQQLQQQQEEKKKEKIERKKLYCILFSSLGQLSVEAILFVTK